jgi:hypothetical protein
MTTRTSVLNLVVVGCIVGATGLAAAKEPVWSSAETRVTAISGSKGTAHLVEILEFPFGHHVGLDAIVVQERHDKPCQISLRPKALGGESKAAAWIISGCSGPSWVDFGYAGVGGDEHPRQFVHGISTCNSKSRNNRRIKGVRVFGARVWKTERRIDERVPLDLHEDHFERPNCDKDTWTAPTFCDEGFVASGIDVHREGDEIVGIALRCRQVDW